jgi:hypothetical protein
LKKKDYNYVITDSPPLSVIQQQIKKFYPLKMVKPLVITNLSFSLQSYQLWFYSHILIFYEINENIYYVMQCENEMEPNLILWE